MKYVAAPLVGFLALVACSHSTGSVLGDEAREWAKADMLKQPTICEQVSVDDFKVVDQGMAKMGDAAEKVVIATYHLTCSTRSHGKLVDEQSNATLWYGHRPDGQPEGKQFDIERLGALRINMDTHDPLPQN